MTVHVGEIASEVSAAGPGISSVPEPRDSPRQQGLVDEEWAELRHRARWLAQRTCAEGFDD